MTPFQRMILRLLYHLAYHVAINEPRASRAMWDAAKDAHTMLTQDTEHEGEAI